MKKYQYQVYYHLENKDDDWYPDLIQESVIVNATDIEDAKNKARFYSFRKYSDLYGMCNLHFYAPSVRQI